MLRLCQHRIWFDSPCSRITMILFSWSVESSISTQIETSHKVYYTLKPRTSFASYLFADLICIFFLCCSIDFIWTFHTGNQTYKEWSRCIWIYFPCQLFRDEMDFHSMRCKWTRFLADCECGECNERRMGEIVRILNRTLMCRAQKQAENVRMLLKMCCIHIQKGER